MDHLTTVAALYFAKQEIGGVPLALLDRVASFLAKRGLPAAIFVVDAPEFNFDKHYDLTKHSNRLRMVLLDGKVHQLAIYSVPDKYKVLEADCLAEADIGYRRGFFYLGLTATAIDSAASLLEVSVSLSQDLLPIRYGIAYHRAQSKLPSLYAWGCGSNSDPLDPEEGRIGEWGRERAGRNRHLAGMFRGAYPASILTERHLGAVVGKTLWGKRVTLRDAGLGSLRSLGNGLCLWELQESEIPVAETALEKAGLIIHD